jgi:para-aminobenzoate synthetase / 4-amino-4-deoxychorismate lyase
MAGYPLVMSGQPRFRLVRRPLGWALTPADVLRLVRTDAHPVALCGTWAGGSDVIAAEPVAVRMAPGELADVLDSDPGDLGETGGSGAFGGGWIGYLGYSAGGEALPPTGPRALPAWWFGFYDHVLRRDRATGEWWFEALWSESRAAALEARFAELTRRATMVPEDSAGPEDTSYTSSPFRLIPGADKHQAAVRAAVDYIHQGDIFQANITLRAEADFAGDPLDAFGQGVTALDPPYAAFIGVSRPGAQGRAAVASLSPELFLRRVGDTVTSKPIKGTARRFPDEREAARQRAELEASAKNRAENVMIVDLVRNDLSRVCVPGSVTAPVLLGPEPHPGVWHLVSTVTGTLRPDAGDGDLIRAAFPPGSVTGAPKVRALEIIDELETQPREVYTGAVGYRSPAAGLELNVAIRTFEFAQGKAWIGAGGGIVADSDPASEYAECLIKASPLLASIGAALDPADADPAGTGTDDTTTGNATTGNTATAETDATAPLRRTDATRRPRPTSGIFSSLVVTDGVTRGLDAHLARLGASVRDLYGKDLPAGLGADLAECLRARPTGRLRITVRPVGGPLQATIEVVPLQPAANNPSVTLKPVTVPGGIGGHKYRDRRLLGDLAAAAKAAKNEQVLLIDETGELLETDRANVFAVIDGVLLTPPADGRLLPGTTRAAVLRAARDHGILVGQKPLTLSELADATEVFVTNAVIGALPVTAVETVGRTWPAGPVTATLAAALATRPPDAPLALAGEFPPSAPVEPGGPHGQSHDVHVAPTLASTGLAARPGGLVARTGGLAARRGSGDLAWRPTRPRRAPAPPLVVLIDNYDSFTWNLAHLLRTAGARVEVVRNDEVTAAQVAAAAPAGVVISPGPCAPAEAGISIATVTACAERDVPLLGICLGHQAIGAAFGAQIVKAPHPVHGKPFPVTHGGGGVLSGLPNPFQATRYHSLMVDEATLPPDLLVTARTDGLPMAIRHRTRRIEGVQFHPESILTTHGPAIITNFVTAAAAPRA